MSGFDLIRNARPWDDDRFPIHFIGSDKGAVQSSSQAARFPGTKNCS